MSSRPLQSWLLGAAGLFLAVFAVLLATGKVFGTASSAAPATNARAATQAPRAQSTTLPTEDQTGPGPATGEGLRTLSLDRSGYPIIWVRAGEHVTIRTAPNGRKVRTVGAHTEFGSRTVYSVLRVNSNGWAGISAPYLENGQLGWVRLDARRLGTGHTFYAISVDLSQRVAELLYKGRVLNRFPVSIGAPGADTPTGRYAVTDTFRGDLNAAYGCCAVALTARQASLPSGWLGGDRIAIHGTYGPVGEAVSHGCIRTANEDVSQLVDRVGLGTPVMIRS